MVVLWEGGGGGECSAPVVAYKLLSLRDIVPCSSFCGSVFPSSGEGAGTGLQQQD